MNSLSSFESLENLAFLVFFNQVFLSCKQEKGMKFQCAEWQDEREIEISMLMMMMMMMKWWWKDEFLLGGIRFTCSECGNVKTCLLQINELFLCCLPLKSFITEFCFDRLPQMAAIKEIFQLLPISSIFWPSLFCFGFDLKQSKGMKPISRNGYGPDWLRRFIDPIAMPCWWAPMAATARVIWLCACVRYWPDRRLVYAWPLL